MDCTLSTVATVSYDDGALHTNSYGLEDCVESTNSWRKILIVIILWCSKELKGGSRFKPPYVTRLLKIYFSNHLNFKDGRTPIIITPGHILKEKRFSDSWRTQGGGSTILCSTLSIGNKLTYFTASWGIRDLSQVWQWELVCSAFQIYNSSSTRLLPALSGGTGNAAGGATSGDIFTFPVIKVGFCTDHG